MLTLFYCIYKKILKLVFVESLRSIYLQTGPTSDRRKYTRNVSISYIFKKFMGWNAILFLTYNFIVSCKIKKIEFTVSFYLLMKLSLLEIEVLICKIHTLSRGGNPIVTKNSNLNITF